VLSPAEAFDRDPRPDVVSVALVAETVDRELEPGRTAHLAGYSGSTPGPLVRAKPGDLLQVHLDNRLLEPTTLHFHGIRVPNAMDGVPDMTQPAVLPGQSFDYSFVVPDAGLYWYHPHYDSVAELGSGLYGPILVEDPDDPPELGDEVVLVLSDLGIDEHGEPLLTATTPDGIVSGSEGSIVLVNGLIHPRLEVAMGRRLRLRILNAARSRYFKLGMAGHSFVLIGGDGGRFSAPLTVTEPVVTPGERLDLLVTPSGTEGSSLELVARPVSRGMPLPESAEAPLVGIDLVPNERSASPPLASLARAIAPLDTTAASEVPIALTLTADDTSVVMGIDGVPGSDADPVHALVGSTQVLVVSNMTPYNHPFHLHGFFFEPRAEDGAPLDVIERKDTIDVPPVSRVKLAVAYDDRPGMWMFHCHILDHAEAGMMGMLHVMR
jgi:FtsP/CotA-like multicopper oxidase with cupredoxin domain